MVLVEIGIFLQSVMGKSKVVVETVVRVVCQKRTDSVFTHN